jgi:hypothetical protein
MNNAKLAVRASTLALSLLVLAGCKLDKSDDDDEKAAPDDIGTVTNSAPSIWGDPQSSIVAGGFYLFQPEAADSDGDLLEFIIANKPEWADFDPASGVLQGVPSEDDVGHSTNIVISVTDQASVASLPSDDPTDEGPTSSPPAISGKPNKSTVVGSLYSFQPEASDSDGDELSFSIVNKPSWASFDTTTGHLEGRPTGADVGRTKRIELSVTDGTSIAALAAFRITVEQMGPSSFTLTWAPPTENEDGTPLNDLSGYRVYYGTASGHYSEEVAVPPGVTSYLIDNLAPGRYFLVMTSVNSHDMESRYTPELSFDVD